VRVLSHVLLRAPLLPASALAEAEAALLRHPLGASALRLASPTLVAHADERAAAARRRYARRAAFRATPQGLLAGVALARVGEGGSRLTLGEPEGVLAPTWERLAALGRALLDTDAGWRAARLRRAPSLLRHGTRASWLTFGQEASARRAEIELDADLARVLEGAERWIAAPTLARRAAPGDAGRALLLQLIDDGLLHHDLEAPLVGPAPLRWACARLAELCPALGQLERLARGPTPCAARLEEAERLLAALPGGAARAVQATLVHAPIGEATLDGRALDRAAALGPLLFALAAALSPPLAEAALVPGLDDALAAAGELVGEGLFDVAALELGAWGSALGGEVAAHPPAATIVSRLAGLIVEAARAGASEIALDAATLAAALPPSPAPPTFELQLSPMRGDETQPGEGWLLGVHAPAGASWGRFAAALDGALAPALDELRRAEAALDGEALRLDVAYAPSRSSADLCIVPALRDAALAVSSWPAEGAVLPAQCAIANDPLGAHRGAVAGGRALEISPLHRVRSTTAPPSACRALLADRLLRQHAPWALDWGPLRRLPWLPRVRLEGFVIAPQSWALPAELDEAALTAWRRAARPPRLIQVGAEDALLPIDLDDPQDRATLAALPAGERARVWEIWPPLGQELDAGGRRIELTCAVVGEPDGRASRLAVLGHGRVPAEARAPGWRTVKLFAPLERHDELLAQIEELVRRRRPRAWFFLPYVEGPGRAHLRVRLRARDERAAGTLALALAQALSLRAPALAEVQIGAYHREDARWGNGIEAVERIFQADSELAIALRLATSDAPIEVLLAAAFDALGAGLGLAEAARAAACARALDAYQVPLAETRERLAPSYRAVQRELAALLDDPLPPLVRFVASVRKSGLGRAHAAALLPALAHLSAVRLCGPERDAEVRALYLWARALESRRARGPAKAARSRR
jgi:thiopeptide-type bacteriocin biosynthesis protein